MNHGQPLIRPDLRSTGRKLKPTCNAPSVTTLRQTKRLWKNRKRRRKPFSHNPPWVKNSWHPLRKPAQSIISKRQATEQDPVARAFATLKVLPVYLREPLSRHLSFLRKKQEADRQKGKKSWQAERYARGTLRKIFERLDRTDHRWLTPGYRSLAGRERLDDLLYLPQLNKHQIQTLATMTAAMFSSTFEKLFDGFGATDGDLTMDVTLKAYQKLARMALHLHAMRASI